MKLRLYKDSVRFRIDMDDVDQLRDTGIVTCTSHFGFGFNHSFIYQVTFVDQPEANVILEGNMLNLQVPLEDGREWLDSAELGYYKLKQFGEHQLRIILEKDLKCLDETSEDQSRMFPNPKD